MKRWASRNRGLLFWCALWGFIFAFYFVVAPAIANPYHQQRLHRDAVCEERGGVMLQISDGPVTCFKGLEKVDLGL